VYEGGKLKVELYVCVCGVVVYNNAVVVISPWWEQLAGGLNVQWEIHWRNEASKAIVAEPW